MEKMKDRLFSAQCVTENPTNVPTMTMWSTPTECMWPKMHNMSASIDEWFMMMGQTGCTVPTEKIMKMMKRVMMERDYENSPIIRKFPTHECGMCGRRIQCCPATNFLMQSYQSTVCESAPCHVEPMTVENWNYMREKYPEWELPTTNEPCNFASIIRESVTHSKVYPFMKKMYMQMMGTDMPTMNCQMVENMCACCCTGYIWYGGRCVAEETMMGSTTMMMGMTNTMMMTEMKTMVPETMVGETTVMPIVETTMMPEVVTTMNMMSTTVHPVPRVTTPKTLFSEDESEEEDSGEDEKRKRRSAEESEEHEEAELEENEAVEELAEHIADEIEEHEGEGEVEEAVAEAIAEEVAAETEHELADEHSDEVEETVEETPVETPIEETAEMHEETEVETPTEEEVHEE